MFQLLISQDCDQHFFLGFFGEFFHNSRQKKHEQSNMAKLKNVYFCYHFIKNFQLRSLTSGDVMTAFDAFSSGYGNLS